MVVGLGGGWEVEHRARLDKPSSGQEAGGVEVGWRRPSESIDDGMGWADRQDDHRSATHQVLAQPS